MKEAILCSVNSFSRALLNWFSLYYVFNLEYEKNSKDILVFLPEPIFGLQENSLKNLL